MSQKQKKDDARGNAEVKFLAGWRARWSNLYGVCFGNADYRMTKLSLFERGDGDFLTVLVAVGGTDGGEVVAFGSGGDLLTALSNLNASIAGAKWKPQKKWDN